MSSDVDAANAAWYDSPARNFGTFDPTIDDLLHTENRPEGDWITETQYFGLSIPEHNIYGYFYLWVHANLNTLSGGLFVCRGLKQNYMQCELFDMIQHNRADVILADDLHTFTLPNGYGVEVIEGGRRMRIRYEDTARGNAVDFTATAIMPAAMRANNRHFEQAMRLEGRIALRGEVFYFHDKFTVRDRSWGQIRNGAVQSLPPVAWLTGCFGQDFAFNINAFDNPARSPDWLGKIAPAKDDPLNDGWVWYEGRLAHLVSVDKLALRDPANGRPLTLDFTMVDDGGRSFHVTGKTVAGVAWPAWWNINIHCNLARWECNGRVGWGDALDCQWNDYTLLCTDPSRAPLLGVQD